MREPLCALLATHIYVCEEKSSLHKVLGQTLFVSISGSNSVEQTERPPFNVPFETLSEQVV